MSIRSVPASSPDLIPISPHHRPASESVEIVTIVAPSAVESSYKANHLSSHLVNHGIKIEAGAIQVRTEQEPIALWKQIEVMRRAFV
jgi:hypothetical protein